MEPQLNTKFGSVDPIVHAEAAVEIIPVHPDKIDVAWPIVEPWVANALKYGPKLYLTEDVYGYLEKQEMILWVAIQSSRVIGMAITSVHQYPRALVADIHWTGGDVNRSEAWMNPMMEVIKGWAKHCKADLLAGGGRRGWIKKYGFKETGVMFEMELNDVQG